MEDVETKVLDCPLPSPTAPPAGWDRLRAQCHVRFPGGDSASPVTGYDDVKQVLPDPRFTCALDAPRISRTESGGVFDRADEPDGLVKLAGLIVGGLTEVPVRW